MSGTRPLSLPFLTSLFLVLALLVPNTRISAYVSPHHRRLPYGNANLQSKCTTSFSSQRRLDTTTTLYDISGWRDLMFENPDEDISIVKGSLESSLELHPKEICILPFDASEVLLQGETKQLRLYEDRFKLLFEYVQDKNCGVVAMGLLANEGIMQTVALCEVEASARVDDFGIFVTIRIVGRAQLTGILQQTPYIRATCKELLDDIPPNFKFANLLARNVELSILRLAKNESQLKSAESNPNGKDTETERLRSKLEKTMSIDPTTNDEDDIDDEEDSDEDDLEEDALDRRKRYVRAYESALQFDTQGYQIAGDSGASDDDKEDQLSPQELTAISWAALCSEQTNDEDAIYRIQALIANDLTERLKLGVAVLSEKKNQIRKRMEKAGLKTSDDEESSGSN